LRLADKRLAIPVWCPPRQWWPAPPARRRSWADRVRRASRAPRPSQARQPKRRMPTGRRRAVPRAILVRRDPIVEFQPRDLVNVRCRDPSEAFQLGVEIPGDSCQCRGALPKPGVLPQPAHIRHRGVVMPRRQVDPGPFRYAEKGGARMTRWLPHAKVSAGAPAGNRAPQRPSARIAGSVQPCGQRAAERRAL